jgi:NADH-quinone oxidoreductase subunit A
MRQYLAVLLTAGFALVVTAGMILLSVLFGPKKKTAVKQEAFECGMPPATEPRGMAHANFYLVAILFVMFDIEIVFLYPWAVSFKELGAGAFWAMAGFLGVLFTALVYAVKKGALEWD